jgi:hypothetical protein
MPKHHTPKEALQVGQVVTLVVDLNPVARTARCEVVACHGYASANSGGVLNDVTAYTFIDEMGRMYYHTAVRLPDFLVEA